MLNQFYAPRMFMFIHLFMMNGPLNMMLGTHGTSKSRDSVGI